MIPAEEEDYRKANCKGFGYCRSLKSSNPANRRALHTNGRDNLINYLSTIAPLGALNPVLWKQTSKTDGNIPNYKLYHFEGIAWLMPNGYINPNLGVSKNRGTPKWMVYNGKPY